jgi:hypothetical protein
VLETTIWYPMWSPSEVLGLTYTQENSYNKNNNYCTERDKGTDQALTFRLP